MHPDQIDVQETLRRIVEKLKNEYSTEKLIHVANFVGANLAEKNCHPDSDRICYGPDHVRCFHELVKGQEYREMDGDGVLLRTIEVVKEPYNEVSDDVGWRMKIISKGIENPFKVPLSDYGFFKESNGGRSRKWLAYFPENFELKLCQKTFCGDPFRSY